MLYTAIVTIAEVAFVEGSGCPDELFIINKCVDTIFIIDMGLQFFLMFPQQPKVRAPHAHASALAPTLHTRALTACRASAFPSPRSR